MSEPGREGEREAAADTETTVDGDTLLVGVREAAPEKEGGALAVAEAPDGCALREAAASGKIAEKRLLQFLQFRTECEQAKRLVQGW